MSDCIAKDICNCHKDSNGTLVCPEHSKRSYFDHTGEEIMEHIYGVSEREAQWLVFSNRVAKHLREYTVPQYGDVGEDLITKYTARDCVEQVTKYAKRFGNQSREGQQELDFVKIAHYTQCAWEKWNNMETDTGIDTEENLVSLDFRADELMEDRGYFYVGKCEYTDGTPTQYIYKRRIL